MRMDKAIGPEGIESCRKGRAEDKGACSFPVFGLLESNPLLGPASIEIGGGCGDASESCFWRRDEG